MLKRKPQKNNNYFRQQAPQQRYFVQPSYQDINVFPDIGNYINNEFIENPLYINLGIEAETQDPVFLNISKAPHILIAGTTGSGKSVCIENILYNIMLKSNPEIVNFYIIDPKMIDYISFRNIPFTKAYATDTQNALNIVQYLRREMMNRYTLLQKFEVKKIDELPFVKKPPKILLIFDELASINAKTIFPDLEEILRLGRASGIHCILGTQRPSSSDGVISGQVKANCPTGIAFKTKTKIDSRVAFDRGGAELLKGSGDGLLFDSTGDFKHFQGHFINDYYMNQLLNWWKGQPLTQQQIDNLKRY